MDLKDRYEALKKKISHRKEPFDKFINFLETETTWLTSPACEEGAKSALDSWSLSV